MAIHSPAIRFYRTRPRYGSVYQLIGGADTQRMSKRPPLKAIGQVFRSYAIYRIRQRGFSWAYWIICTVSRDVSIGSTLESPRYAPDVALKKFFFLTLFIWIDNPCPATGTQES